MYECESKFVFDGRVWVLELLYYSLQEGKAHIYWFLVKIFSLFIFFRPSFSMPGEFDFLFFFYFFFGGVGMGFTFVIFCVIGGSIWIFRETFLWDWLFGWFKIISINE